MSDLNIYDHRALVDGLVQQAQEDDPVVENLIADDQSSLMVPTDAPKRLKKQEQMIKMRTKQVERWRNIVYQIKLLSARLELVGDHRQAREVRWIRDKYVAKLESGEEELQARQATFGA
jgi:hypothetical protein